MVVLLLSACGIENSLSAPSEVASPVSSGSPDAGWDLVDTVPPLGGIPGDLPANEDTPACGDAVALVEGERFDDLQQALDAAPGGAVVHVCPGVHEVNLMVERSVVLRSTAGPDETVLDGGELGAVVRVAAGDIELDGLTLRNGLRAHKAFDDGGGGLDASLASSARVEDCVFRDNAGGEPISSPYPRGHGGGILGPSDGLLEVVSTRFVGNEANNGGAIAATRLVARDIVIEDGYATGYGGGIWLSTGSDAEISGTFLGNHAGRGGAVWLEVTGAPTIVLSGEIGSTETKEHGLVFGTGLYMHAEACVGCAVDATDLVMREVVADQGAGVQIEVGTETRLSWTGGRIEEAEASINGAGMYLLGEAGEPGEVTIEGLEMEAVTANRIACLDAHQVAVDLLDVRLVDCDGGAFSVWAGAASLTDVAIEGGRAHQGGGLYVVDSVVDATRLSIEDSVATWSGAAIFSDTSEITIDEGSFVANDATTSKRDEAAALSVYASTVTLTSGTWTDNLPLDAFLLDDGVAVPSMGSDVVCTGAGCDPL